MHVLYISICVLLFIVCFKSQGIAPSSCRANNHWKVLAFRTATCSNIAGTIAMTAFSRKSSFAIVVKFLNMIGLYV